MSFSTDWMNNAKMLEEVYPLLEFMWFENHLAAPNGDHEAFQVAVLVEQGWLKVEPTLVEGRVAFGLTQDAIRYITSTYGQGKTL